MPSMPGRSPSRPRYPPQKGALLKGFASAKAFWQAPTDLDLYDLAKQINAQVSDNNVKAKGTGGDESRRRTRPASPVHRQQVQHGPRHHHHRASRRPVQKNADWTYYHSLDFAQTTGWDEFEDLLAS